MGISGVTGIKRSKLPLNPDKIIEDINLEELIQMLKRFGKGCLGLGVVAVFAISQEAVAQVANVAQASESNSAEIKKIITEEFNLTPEARIKKLSEQNEQLKAQQDFFLKEILKYKNILSQTPGSGASGNIKNSNGVDLEQLQVELSKKNEQLEKDKKNFQKLADYIIGLKKDLQEKENLLSAANTELVKLKEESGELTEKAKVCSIPKEDRKKILLDSVSYQKNLDELNAKINEKDSGLQECSKQLAQSEAKVAELPELKKQVIETRNELMMRETELAMLSKKTVVSSVDRNKANNVKDYQRGKLFENSGRKAAEEVIGKKPNDITSDLTIVEVLGDKVALRSGPSSDDSEIMSVAKGTRLTVEDRQDDWYRVVAPNSIRAYIRLDMVRVVSGTGNEMQSKRLFDDNNQGIEVRKPRKKPLRASDADMEAFGEVSGSSDRFMKAFQNIKKGLKKDDQN